MISNRQVKDAIDHDKDDLINELKIQGIVNCDVLDTIWQVPRHLFVGKDMFNFAYENRSLPIGEAQTISQPYIVAYMTQVLFAEKKPEKVLEIGTGSGYQTAVLATLTPRVFTIERIKSLYNKARKVLRSLKFENIHFRYGDGTKGWMQFAPFDAIIITAACETISEILLKQLAVGGRLIAPQSEGEVNDDNPQYLVLIEHTEQGFKTKKLQAVKFVPLIS